ncbi:MAG: flagellar hook assembly protein FlgD [Treponema sp.]|nr:flagellar hook assembly protein FlgD [Treponema sp.]
MEFTATMSAAEKLQTQNAVNSFNKTLAVNGRTASQKLGKDDFLKLLLTQLSHQDPSSPMDNNQFIAQMAQFSSLEQMTNMNAGFEKMTTMMKTSDAMNAVGKTVQIDSGDMMTKGVVESVTYGENPQVQVNGTYYDMNRIKAVYDN